MHEYEGLRRKVHKKIRGKYPLFVKPYAQYLYHEHGLTRMQVQGAIFILIGQEVAKETLRKWLYVEEYTEVVEND